MKENCVNLKGIGTQFWQKRDLNKKSHSTKYLRKMWLKSLILKLIKNEFDYFML